MIKSFKEWIFESLEEEDWLKELGLVKTKITSDQIKTLERAGFTKVYVFDPEYGYSKLIKIPTETTKWSDAYYEWTIETIWYAHGDWQHLLYNTQIRRLYETDELDGSGNRIWKYSVILDNSEHSNPTFNFKVNIDYPNPEYDKELFERAVSSAFGQFEHMGLDISPLKETADLLLNK